jgi:GTPase SAR1 family protein
MSNPGPAAAVADAPDAVRVVLFAPSGAGKSSLLAALAQSAVSQQHLLNGTLTDHANGLAELRKRLYGSGDRGTGDEIEPHAVDFLPFANAGTVLGNRGRIGAILIDCDGQAANNLLAREEVLSQQSPPGALARQVVQADTILLIVDASGTLPQIDAEFAAFERFLRLLEEDRGDRAEVSGLPVFLVLSKCDLLAHSGESAGAWMERIEERKRDVDGLFRDFFARRSNGGPMAFGGIDLHVWATAIKRPALAGSAAKSDEPFGVAELFRQCLEQAVLFRDHKRRSGRRLLWTAGGAASIAAALLALTIGLVVTNREGPANDLRARVEEMRFSEDPSAAERLRGTPTELRRRLATFSAVLADPDFPSLPARDRDYVHGRVSELEEYIAYYEKLRQAARPGDVSASDKLREITEELQALSPPREDWAPTEAGRLQAERLAEALGLATAVEQVKRAYEEDTQRGRDLWVFARYQPTAEAPAINWRSWYDEAARLLDPASDLPFSAKESIPGTTLTYATALRFDRVAETRAEFEGVKEKLHRVVDLGAALGLVGDVKGCPPVLVIPRPPGFALERVQTRLKEMQEAYPRYQTEFVLPGLPDAIVPEVRQAARSSYEYLLAPAREAVQQQLKAGGGEDVPAARAGLGTWLGQGPAELAPWRTLALLLSRLNDPKATDPVTALADFLAKTSFSIEIRQVTLEVPYRYSEVKPRAGASFVIYHPATVSEGPAIVCAPAGEGERDDTRKVTVCTFRPRERSRLTYHPGEALWAAVELRDGQSLNWTRGSSTAFQFERLVRPPRLQATSAPNSEGTAAEGIELLITPTDGVPRLPDLMPGARTDRSGPR